jgi:TolB-like protein/tetratricopeptide (TPR) repeat protein
MSNTLKLLHDLRRRRVFRLAGLYIVGAWIVIEVSSVFFPAWGIPDTALRFLFIAAALLFPVAIVFSWVFDITSEGIVRTKPAAPGEDIDTSLKRSDYLVLLALAAVGITVLLGSLQKINEEIELHPVLDTVIQRVENSVAVLPFLNLDTNPDTGYFSDGVTEEILHRLSATRALHVFGSTSTFAFRNSEDSPARISEVLGVEYLLHGSIRRDDDFVRVTARLLDQQGLQVWSQSFDRKLESIFIIQSEIASAVASEIVKEIVSTHGASSARATTSMTAYNLYLVGRAYTKARPEGWHEKSEKAFRESIEFDPEFAPAYAGLAYSLFIMRSVDNDRWEEAVWAARKSIELDENIAEGYAILGIIQANSGPDEFAAGERNLRRAIEIDPAMSIAYNWLSLALRAVGRFDESESIMAQGLTIDPLNPPIVANVAGRLSNEGDFATAERMILRLTQLPEPPRLVDGALFEIYSEWGRYSDALRWFSGPFSVSAYEALGLTERVDGILEVYAQEDPIGFMELQLTALHSRGRHKEAWDKLDTFIQKNVASYEDVDPDYLGTALITQVLAGKYDLAVSIFLSLADEDPALLVAEMFAPVGLDTQNALAFAYMNTGDTRTANEILEFRHDKVVRLGNSTQPALLEILSLNQALQGNHDDAYKIMVKAVDNGWANYYRVIHDPRWGNTLEQPRFVELFKRVQENLATQREIVVARESGET